MKLRDISVSLELPHVGKISGTWTPDKDQINASWELYVELITRVSITKLGENKGLIREALNSLYILFQTSRDLLKKYGPSVAVNRGDMSFGYLTIRILNEVIRPFLSKWHPLLDDYETTRKDGVSELQHENEWGKNQEFHDDLNTISDTLYQYSLLLAKAAGIPSLLQK